MKQRLITVCIGSLFTFLFIISEQVTALDIQVMPFSGALKIERHDIVIDGNRQPLVFKRMYRSDDHISDVMGPCWSHNYQYEADFREHKKDIVVFGPENTVMQFRKTEPKKKKSNTPVYAAYDGKRFARKIGFSLEADMGENAYLYFGKRGELTKLKDEKDRFILFKYTGDKLKQASGFFGLTISFTYDDSGLLVRSETNQGKRLDYRYDDKSRLTDVYLNGEPAEHYRYNKNGRLALISVKNGRKWKIAYYKSGKVARITEPTGYTTQYSFRETNKTREFITVAPNGGKTVTRYFKDNSTIETVDPTGGVTVINMDPVTQQVLKRIDPVGNKTSYLRDNQGRLTRISAPENQITTIKYKKESRFPWKIKEPDGNTITLLYDDKNNPVSIKNKRYGEQSFTFDKEGRVTFFKDFDGTKRHLNYSNGWIPSEIKGDKGTLVKVEFDDKGIPVVFDSGSGKQSVGDYKALNDAVMKSLIPVNDFSMAGKPISTDDGLTTFMFNAMGDISKVVYPLGWEKTYSYDLGGRITGIRLPDGTQVGFRYDKSGNLKTKSYKDGSLNYAYDGLNRLKEIKGPEGFKTVYSRNVSGKPTTINHSGIKRTLDYDSHGRITSSEYETEDDTGLKSSSLTRVKVSYEKDASGRLTREVKTKGDTVSYGYDETDVLVSIDSDVFGRIGFDNKGDGSPKEITYPNGIKEIVSEAKGIYTHKVMKGNTILYSESVKTDANDTTRELSINGKHQAFSYDNRGQLVSVKQKSKVTEYGYDSWGNRTRVKENGKTIQQVYKTNGRLFKDGNKTYGWDIRGNLASIKSKDRTIKTSFDLTGKLQTVSDNTGKTVSYQYDENGMMLSRRSKGKTTWIVYDELDPVMELERYMPDDKKERVVRRFLTGDHVGEVLAMSRLEEVSVKGKQKILEKVYYLHRDRRGNVVLITDASGSKTASFTYSPFGELVSKEGSWTPPFLFGSHRYEPEFDFYYMRARFYDPKTGRFLSPDPVQGVLEDALSTNPYLYAKNSPMDFNDPLGLTPQKVAKVNKTPAKPKSWWDYFWGHQATTVTSSVKGTGYDTVVETMKNTVKNQKVVVDSWSVSYTKQMKVSGKMQNVKRTFTLVEKKPRAGVKLTADRMGNFYNAGKLVVAYADIKNQQAMGLISEEDAHYALKAEMMGGVIGGVMDIVTAKLTTTGPQGVVLGQIVNWSTDNYKELIKERGNAEQARANAIEREIIGENTPYVLARRKVTKIKSLINKGDEKSLKEANRLNDILFDYTDKYAAKDKHMDKLFYMSSDFGSKISDKLSAIRKKRTEQFNKEMAERKRIVEEMEQYGTYGKQDEPEPVLADNAETSGGGDIMFEDVDRSQVMMAKSSIANDRYARNTRSDAAINSESADISRAKYEQIKAFAEGMQTVGEGLQTAYVQSKAFDADLKARTDAQNARMKSVVDNYSSAQAAKKQAFTDKYGDPLGREAYAANGKAIPSHMMPKSNSTASYTPTSSKPVSKPKTPTYTGGSSSSGAGKQPVRTTLRHYKVYSKIQFTRKDGIPISPGDWMGAFDALIGHRYGKYTVKKTTGKGSTLYIPSNQSSTHARVKQWLKDGKVTVTYKSEKVVLVDGKVVPADIYNKSTQKMNSMRNQLHKKGIKTTNPTWK